VIPSDRQATIAPGLCVSAPKTHIHVRPHAAGNKAEKVKKQVKAAVKKQERELKNRQHETAQNAPGAKKRKAWGPGS
jgi:phosphoglycerate dehydrogenase-like enzyme